jgi:tetratricopeptide (TPR) repeat protein
VNNSTSTAEPATAVLTLAECSAAAEAALAANEPDQAATLTQIILRRLPRHLLSYGRLLRAAWQLKRWDEGEDWGRRLLRADPGNGAAWRALARAAEGRKQRAAARAAWQRAFESDPYEPEIRSGLSRTTLGTTGAAVSGDPDALALNPACLARLYLRGYRWDRAERVYRQLITADPRRIDFQVGLLGALWQRHARREAYDLARHLTQHHPHLLIAWTVLDDLGDVNDQALARNPIATMDPDGEFVRQWFGLPFGRSPFELNISHQEAALVREWLNR